MPSKNRRIALTVPDVVYAALLECRSKFPHYPMSTLCLTLIEASLIRHQYLKGG